ncbi:molybdate ABC transporter substrate-binding protein [Ferrimonas balearica]|uniref:molybdate ABC transporter substrate-binding protein n=1 Tax=Ferrimonas balearica TaxID=44012 RepID=UPI001C996A72|nr:molybdate ABC transporter substrate-binding protein [Ferrimonas balearica]MBY5993273.1 molybdate ABC transporter substrate-binding protein [Ferrimonas balearica]
MSRWCAPLSLCLALLLVPVAQATTLTVAVAANFKTTLEQLVADYQAQTGVRVQISAGATGALYTQILHGAPYDLFLAADDVRPAQLVAQGLADPDSLSDYAIGVLAFWHPKGRADETTLAQWDQRLAMANPRTAPYGAAAEQVAQHLDILHRLRGKIVRGTNILHTFQYVQSGNAPAGLVSLAQLKAAEVPPQEYWLVPESWHGSLTQQGVVLTRSAHPQQAKALLQYLMARDDLLSQAGYAIPDDHQSR